MTENSVTETPPTNESFRESMAVDLSGIEASVDRACELIDSLRQDRAELLDALKAMVESYDGVRDVLTSPVVIEKLARADAAIAKAEGAK